jgi:hypothetical protein
MKIRGWKLAVALAVLALLAATGFTILTLGNVNAQSSQGAPDSIKLLTFYEKGCCKSCGDVDTYIQEALNKYYPEEVKAGKISAQFIDMKTDKVLTAKYGVTNWALKLVVTRNGQESVIDVPEIWMYTGDKVASINCVKAALDKAMGR